MNLLLILTFCLTLSTIEAFLLPREVNLGKPVKVAVEIKSHENDDNQEKRSATAKNAQKELKFLMTLVQAFGSHPKFVVLWGSLPKSKPASENIDIGPFTLHAWLQLKNN